MKKLLCLVLSLVLALSTFGVAFAEEKSVKIGILASATTHGWLGAVAYNAEQRCKELGVEYRVETASNAEEMTTQLDTLLLWGAEAIVIFPQWGGMEVPVKQAIDQGVTVVSFDITIDVDGIYLVTGDNVDMGVQGAHYMAEKLGGVGQIVVLDVPSSPIAPPRLNGFLDTLAEIAPEIEVIGTFATEFKRENGLKDMADVLTKLPHIDGVYSMDDETSIGALEAIKDAGRTDIKVITGGGGCQEYFNMMPQYQDMWVESALYSPAMIRDAVDTAIAVLNGEAVEFEKIIPTTIVDKDNYQEFLDENSPY